MSFAIQPITPTIGAEILGVVISQIDEAIFPTVRQALLDHLVIVFRDQHLRPEDHLTFARRFGELEPPHPVFAHLPDHAQVVPECGGDTLWSNMYAAYDTLAEPIKTLIDGLTAVHDICGGGPYGRVPNYREIVLAQPEGRRRLSEIESEFPPVSHPVVRMHPQTGRRALFVNRSFTTRIEGISKLESAWLLGMLLEHAEQTAFQLRHRWRKNDLVMWDNRCTQHLAVADYAPAHRLMHRITVQGDRPVRRIEQSGRAA